MQESSVTTGNRRNRIAVSVLSLLVWVSGLSAAFALNVHPAFLKSSFRNVTKTVLFLPQTLPAQGPMFRSFSASALRSIPSDLASNLSPLNTVLPVTLGSPDFEALAYLGKELHCGVMGKLSFLVAQECNTIALALAAPSKEAIVLLGTDPREIAVVGTDLSLLGGVMPSDIVSSVLALSVFSSESAKTAVSANIPHIARAEILPIAKENKGIVLGESTSTEASLATKRTVSFLDRISLSLFCALSKNVDEERCKYDALVKMSFLAPPTIPDISSFSVPEVFLSVDQTGMVAGTTTVGLTGSEHIPFPSGNIKAIDLGTACDTIANYKQDVHQTSKIIVEPIETNDPSHAFDPAPAEESSTQLLKGEK